ncbi:MAG: hypothetical protein ACYDAG_11935, partial [Chloroflexota bacterium]
GGVGTTSNTVTIDNNGSASATSGSANSVAQQGNNSLTMSVGGVDASGGANAGTVQAWNIQDGWSDTNNYAIAVSGLSDATGIYQSITDVQNLPGDTCATGGAKNGGNSSCMGGNIPGTPPSSPPPSTPPPGGGGGTPPPSTTTTTPPPPPSTTTTTLPPPSGTAPLAGGPSTTSPLSGTAPLAGGPSATTPASGTAPLAGGPPAGGGVPGLIPGLGGGGLQGSLALGFLLLPAGLASLLAGWKRRRSSVRAEERN